MRQTIAEDKIAVFVNGDDDPSCCNRIRENVS
jgi:hypothetical protein